MSKKCKNASKLKRLQQKRARRAANKARYQTMARAGENSKSKRFVKRGKAGKKAGQLSHSEGHCGNTACLRCFPNQVRKPKEFVTIKQLLKLPTFNKRVA